jgi:hypothetical protein
MYLLLVHIPILGHNAISTAAHVRGRKFVQFDDVECPEKGFFFDIFSNCRKGEELQFWFRDHYFPGTSISACLPTTWRKAPEFGLVPGRVVWISSETIKEYGKDKTNLFYDLSKNLVQRYTEKSQKDLPVTV